MRRALKELECYPALTEELRNNSDYSDKDLTTLKLTVLDSYEPTIKEVDKAIRHFQYSGKETFYADAVLQELNQYKANHSGKKV